MDPEAAFLNCMSKLNDTLDTRPWLGKLTPEQFEHQEQHDEAVKVTRAFIASLFLLVLTTISEAGIEHRSTEPLSPDPRLRVVALTAAAAAPPR